MNARVLYKILRPLGMLSVGMLSAGCGSAARTATATSTTGSITVFAAASLTGSFTELGRRFEAAHPGSSVKFSFGASSALAQQIIAGAPADVFASASETNMAQVAATGAVSRATTFATNSAAVAVSPRSSVTVTSIADLGKAGVKVALCQPEVPCGSLAVKVLATAGVTVKPVTRGLDVKSTLAYVLSGEADAAIVYASDVLAAGDKVKAIQIPAADNASTAYPIASVASSKHLALAAAFNTFVLSDDGRHVLSDAGFGAP